MPDNLEPKELLFLESIKWDGAAYGLLPYHEARIARTWAKRFGGEPPFKLAKVLPVTLGPTLTKVRLIYGQGLLKVTSAPYVLPEIKKAILVKSELDYGDKFLDRSEIEALKAQAKANQPGAEIIIVKNGFITDSSIANLVFQDRAGNFKTPLNPLLPGVKRAALIDASRIAPTPITPGDLGNYLTVSFINAMIDLEDNVRLDISDIS
ncbi:MAG: aminotransferase class IV [Deltaproteobacteria bacterium]|nr:aminotransferase class IV [Deltaproteobacteria bacterium]